MTTPDLLRAGDLNEAVRSVVEIHALWRMYGVLPEDFDLSSGKVRPGMSRLLAQDSYSK